jgi:hypothetical protein
MMIKLDQNLKDFSVYISFHQAKSLERRYYFRCCLKSAAAQGCRAVLIHDEKSELTNKEDLNYAKDLGIELYQMEDKNDTGYSKYQKSLELCETKYVSILQDDDWYDHQKTRKIAAILKELNREFILITTNLRIMTDGLVKGEWSVKNRFFMPPSKWVINTELMKKNDPIPEVRYCWDKALAYQFLDKGDILHIPLPLTYYTFHEEQLSTVIVGDSRAKDLLAVENYIKNFKENHVYIYREGALNSTSKSKLVNKFYKKLKANRFVQKLMDKL